MSINGWVDKENVVHHHNGILLSPKENKIMTLAENGMELELLYKVKTLRCRYCLFEVLYVCGWSLGHETTKGAAREEGVSRQKDEDIECM